MDYVFKVIVEECEEGGYYAECPAFQGCHAEADTYEDVMLEIKDVVAGFVDEYIRHNEPLPVDNYSIASIRIAV
jgi:predicted RNase H-like HicB family nuclease